MAIQGIKAVQAKAIASTPQIKNNSFKDVLQNKINQQQVLEREPPSLSIKNTFQELIKTHEVNKQTMTDIMANKNYSLDKLLNVQYKTGVLFLREQMLCRTAELSANTLKTFTQMQI